MKRLVWAFFLFLCTSGVTALAGDTFPWIELNKSIDEAKSAMFGGGYKKSALREVAGEKGNDIHYWKVHNGTLAFEYSKETRKIVRMSFLVPDERPKSRIPAPSFNVIRVIPVQDRVLLLPADANPEENYHSLGYDHPIEEVRKEMEAKGWKTTSTKPGKANKENDFQAWTIRQGVLTAQYSKSSGKIDEMMSFKVTDRSKADQSTYKFEVRYYMPFNEKMELYLKRPPE